MTDFAETLVDAIRNRNERGLSVSGKYAISRDGDGEHIEILSLADPDTPHRVALLKCIDGPSPVAEKEG